MRDSLFIASSEAVRESRNTVFQISNNNSKDLISEV